MTDMEKRLQRAQVKIDLEDAEANLAHLQVSANRHTASIKAILRKIDDNAELQPTRDDFDTEAELRQRLTPDEISLLRRCADESVSLIVQLRQERQKVFQFREQDAMLNRASLRSIA